MKKKITLLLMLAITVFTLTGCDSDDDANTAYFFEGYWEGQMGTNFYGELGYGTSYYYTQLDIVRDNKYGGYGVERDYYSQYNYSEIKFNWTVQDGHIYFQYYNGRAIALDFSAQSSYDGTDRMLMRAYDYASGNVIGSAELYRINDWYNDWYDDPYWAKQNKLWTGKEE